METWLYGGQERAERVQKKEIDGNEEAQGGAEEGLLLFILAAC